MTVAVDRIIIFCRKFVDHFFRPFFFRDSNGINFLFFSLYLHTRIIDLAFIC